MSDHKGPSTLTTATGLALVGFDAWLAANGYTVPVGSVTALAVPYVLGKVGREKVERLWAAVRRALIVEVELDEDEADREIRRLLDDPKEAEKLYDSFRSMMSSRSEAAWPYAARLAAHYGVRKLEPDTFFRRAGWLLERCECGDIEIIADAARRTKDKLVGVDLSTYDGVRWTARDEGLLPDLERPGAAENWGANGTYPSRAGRTASTHMLIVDSRLSHPIGSFNYFPLSEPYLDRLIELFTLTMPVSRS